ncbi:MAG: carotenoid biosynthesis protein [Flavobacteriales bacterium]|nr:carotenoid biosynthesis protein [Flavobacteriales bacterium]
MPWRVTSVRYHLGGVVVFHAVGLVGLWWSPWKEIFVHCTPVAIAGVALLAFGVDKCWTPTSILRLILCGVLGFFAEVAGVQKGWIFGSYRYGNVLGPMVLDVPLLLVLNWMWVIYGAQQVLEWIKVPGFTYHPYLTAALLVGYDVLLEKFATQFGLWFWQDGQIPFGNYVGWFVVSLLLASIWRPTALNKFGAQLFLFQISFFALSWLFSYFQ